MKAKPFFFSFRDFGARTGAMSVVTLKELKMRLGPGQCLLGLDFGSKTIGLAVADPDGIIASPLGTIRRRKFTDDAHTLARTVRERNVGGLVFGLPVSMDGSEGPRCQSTRQFAANLLERMDIGISFWDERLSTSAVEKFLIGEADMTRKRRGEVVDKMAAAYILQGALDSLAE